MLHSARGLQCVCYGGGDGRRTVCATRERATSLMSTATPAAPSAPSALPAPDCGAQPTPVATQVNLPAPKAVKPIPSLPGVYPDADPPPSPPSDGEAGDARSRDAAGRFVASPATMV